MPRFSIVPRFFTALRWVQSQRPLFRRASRQVGSPPCLTLPPLQFFLHRQNQGGGTRPSGDHSRRLRSFHPSQVVLDSRWLAGDGSWTRPRGTGADDGDVPPGQEYTLVPALDLQTVLLVWRGRLIWAFSGSGLSAAAGVGDGWCVASPCAFFRQTCLTAAPLTADASPRPWSPTGVVRTAPRGSTRTPPSCPSLRTGRPGSRCTAPGAGRTPLGPPVRTRSADSAQLFGLFLNKASL